MDKLAILGGAPVRTAPFSPWPVYGQAEEKALDQAVYAGQWGTLGEEDARFARTFQEYLECKHVVPVSSGTVGLELALRSLGIGYGDEVIVPAYTFAATVSAVAMMGATPVLCDIQWPSCNLGAAQIESCITPRTRAVIVVHIGGNPCDMGAIIDLCKRKKIALVEDAAHAHGGTWQGQKLGTLGDVGVFSFQSSKNMTSGEGGAIVTNDEEIYEECWRYHHSGRVLRGSSEFGGLTLIGTNARITEFQASVLTAQLSRLEEQLRLRQQNAALLRRCLGQLPGILLPQEPDAQSRHAYHLFIALLDDAQAGKRDAWIEALNAEGIPAYAGYPNLAKMGFLALDNQNFRKSTGTSIDYASLPLPGTQRAERAALWLHGSLLLGQEEDTWSICAALEKVAKAMA